VPRSALEQLEQSDLDLRVAIVWLVSGSVTIPEPELKAARRRAMLVLAAGGDPHRDLELGDVAVERLADELDAGERQTELSAALAALDADGLPNVSAAIASLTEDADLAWRMFALALLADELANE
jgi:putative heme iron utilization protein